MSSVTKNNAAAHIGPDASGVSHFFYTTTSGKLCAFIKKDNEDYYDQQPVIVEAKGNVSTQTKKGSPIEAVGYKFDGEDQIRVYYITSDSKLKELCWSPTRGYFAGALSRKQYSVADDTGLAASASGGLLEVYCKLEKYDDSYARIWLRDQRSEIWNDTTLVRSDF